MWAFPGFRLVAQLKVRGSSGPVSSLPLRPAQAFFFPPHFDVSPPRPASSPGGGKQSRPFVASVTLLRPRRLEWRHGPRPLSLVHFNSRGILELHEQPPLRRAACYSSGTSLARHACPCLALPARAFHDPLDPTWSGAGWAGRRAGWPGLRWAATAGFLGWVGATGRLAGSARCLAPQADPAARLREQWCWAALRRGLQPARQARHC